MNDGSLNSNVATVSLTVAAVNDAPTFTAGPNQVVNENAGPQSVPAWASGGAGPADESGQALTYTVIGNSNPGLFSAGPTVAADGTLSYTPAVDASGNATITVELADDGGTANGGVDTSAPRTFTITVNAVIAPPTITAIGDQAIDEDTTTGALGFTVGDGDTPLGSLVLTGSSSDPAIVPNGNIVFAGTGAARTVTVTPAPNANGGPVTITVSVSDGTTTVPTAFAVTVAPVNDTPTIAPIGDQSVNAGSPLTFTASGSDIDLPAQPLSYSLAAGETACNLVSSCSVPSGATIDGSTGAFSWTPSAGQAPGTYRFEVQVSDGAMAASSEFMVTVNPVVVSNPRLVLHRTDHHRHGRLVGHDHGAASECRRYPAVVGCARREPVVDVDRGLVPERERHRQRHDRDDPQRVEHRELPLPRLDCRNPDRHRGRRGAHRGDARGEGLTPSLVFTTSPQSTTPGISTGTITIQRRNYAGAPLTSGPLTVTLTDTSATVIPATPPTPRTSRRFASRTARARSASATATAPPAPR